MAESISYIKVGNQDHPIDAVTVNGLTLTSQEKNSWNEKQDALTFDSIPTEDSNNPVKSGGVYEMITDNELVIATALNDLNDRLLDVEDNSLTSESDPVFMSSPASSITVANISTWNAKQDALTFDSLPTENSDNLVKSGALYTVLTNTELVVATALNDLNQRVSSNQSSISNLYEEIDRALTAVLTYRGTVGSNGDYTSLPSSHEVGDVYVVSSAGTFAGQSCEVGDYIICKTSRSTASDNDWNVVNGENQVSNSAATLAAAGSNVTIATVDGTNITISTPASWTGVNKNGTLTGVTVNGVSASVSNGVASVSVKEGDYVIDLPSGWYPENGDFGPYVSLPTGTYNAALSAFNSGRRVIIRSAPGSDATDAIIYAEMVYNITNDDAWTGLYFEPLIENDDNIICAFHISANDDLQAEKRQKPIFNIELNGVYASVSYGTAHLSLTYDSIPTENSDNLVKSGDLYTVIVDNEEVTAAALNDLNDRMINVENGMVNFSEQDPIFSNSPASSITSSNISSWNAKQDALTFDSVPTENSDNLVKSGDLYTVITQNEFVAAAALNDLNDRVEVLEENQYSFDSLPTENSENLVNSGALYSVIVSNERVVATALNDVNDRLMVLENNMSDAFEDVESILQTSEEVTAAALNDLHSRVNALETGSGGGGGITGVTFNGTAASISNGIASISVSIPAAVTSTTVSGWGFTKNSGTITGISMNGSSKGTSGNVNLGNVVTAVSFNGTSVSPSSGVVTIAESDPVFSASVAASITASDISNWNSKANSGWYVRVGSGSSGNLLDGVPIDLYGGGCIHMSGGTNLIIDDNNNSGSVVLYNTMDWSGIVRTSVSTYANVENASDIRTLQDDLNLIYNKVPDVTSANLGKSLVATYDGTNGFHWEASTIRQLPEVTSSDVNGSSGKILVASYDSTNGYHWEKTGSVTLYYNGQIAVPGSVGTTYFDTIGVFRNDRASWDWIQTGTSSSSRRTLQSDLDAIRQLPAVSSSQNGQVLQVVNGQWTLVTPVSIYSGSSNPNNSQGTNGDLYLQTS